MSGLAGVLAGRIVPGVHRWHAGFDVADVADAVRGADWRFGHVDGWQASTKVEVLDAIGKALDFADHYGHNFDALADCLGDLASDTVLLWDGWSTLARADERSFGIVLDVLEERCAERGTARFVVLLRGDGPDLPHVASLD